MLDCALIDKVGVHVSVSAFDVDEVALLLVSVLDTPAELAKLVVLLLVLVRLDDVEDRVDNPRVEL